MKQRKINIDKVIREIRLRKIRREKMIDKQLAYNDGLEMAIRIIEDNIKEDKSSTTYTDHEFKKKFFPKKYREVKMKNDWK